MEIETRTRQWGSSLGVILPKEIVQKEGLKENQIIKILAIKTKEKTKVKDIFGKLKFKKKTKALLEEIDREFESE